MSNHGAKFVEGSTMKHILVMTGAGSVGLMGLFVVDLLDMLFISMLGQVELAAAIGFAGTLTFFSTSISIGTSIAMGALVSKAIGAKQRQKAREFGTSVVLTAFLISTIVSVVMFIYIPELLHAIGAEGVAAERAADYLRILIPSGPILSLAMSCGSGLRAAGDAKRSMWSKLYGGIVNAALDPLFIFVFGWNVEGAAIASVIARCTVLFFSIYPLIKEYDLLAMPSLSRWLGHLKTICAIAVPAIITNTATPIGNAIITAFIAKFGEDYVAGFAVIGRLVPVVFCIVFALSGAIGPIIGQNFGAERFDRIKDILKNSILVTVSYVVVVCIILYFAQGLIIDAFKLTGDASLIVATFCTFIAVSYIFNGTLFVANASFNNLGKPLYSTALNLSKATIGTYPFVYLGSHLYGAVGVLYGSAVGTVFFGSLAIVVLRRHITHLMRGEELTVDDDPSIKCVNTQPFCSHDAMLIEEVTAATKNSEDEYAKNA
ncbi:MATE family efflux transporter [Vibrio marisflavi]|uniref:Multidrug resistance protein NorM n=1 Tax=Vibrio marisflavi CECT 7928 TaxID=634439 RepID=A0ABN8E263_9VIBR|nr:MATE family efflux transporter [Vibrio marisflavi]CAH0539184.1 Multidrug export protein MepA [Vibrio marisflavi CECT 7928]